MNVLKTLFGANGAGYADAAYCNSCREMLEVTRLIQRFKRREREALGRLRDGKPRGIELKTKEK